MGDGETQISLLSPNEEFPIPLRMPTTTGSNEPIITAYGIDLVQNKIFLGNDLLGDDEKKIQEYYANFKVKPTEAIKVLPEKAQATILQKCEAYDRRGIMAVLKRDDSPQFIMAKCIREFTNAIFTHEIIASAIGSYQDKCKEICVFVGHPTKWDQYDLLLYKTMLEDSILGQGEFVYNGRHIPLTFDVEPESRAAFLYGRRQYASDRNDKWEIDKYTLVIDVGSSTVDVSAMSGLEPDNVHDGGHPFLGARLIDKAIYKYYRKVLEEKRELSTLDRLLKENPTLENRYILACRKGKEEYFSSSEKAFRVGAPSFSISDLKKPRKEMETILATPLPEIDSKVQWSEPKSWEHELEKFLTLQKSALDSKEKIVNRIILTGGASRMDFVKDTCKRVLSKPTIYYDHNPGVAISHGLALVGRSNEKSAQFRQEAESLLGDDLQVFVKTKTPILAERLSETIASIILDDIAFPELRKWKSRSPYKTLDGAIEGIKEKCTESNLKNKLSSNSSYQQILKDWVEKDLIVGINAKLLNLCKKYGLTDFKTKDVDITTVSIDSKEISGISGSGRIIASQVLNPADALAALIALIAGIVTFTVIPTVLAIVIPLIIYIAGAISTTLVGIIISILVAIPGVGWTILAALAGVSAAVLVAQGWQNMRDDISKAMMSYDLPKWIRNRVSDDKIKSALNDSKDSVKSKIESELKSSKTSTKIAESVADSLSLQIEKKIQEIRYIIESR